MSTRTLPQGTFVDFQQVKSSVSILQILERYDLVRSLTRTADRLSGPCPLHGGTNVTQFRVSVSKNCFNCFGNCGRGGNVIDFVSMKEGIPFRDAALLIQEWFMSEQAHARAADAAPLKTAQTKPRPPKPPASHPPVSESPPGDSEHSSDQGEAGENPPLSFELKSLKSDHPYLSERGLSETIIAEYGLGYCPKGCLRGYIAIPIRNRGGAVVAYIGRWPGDPTDRQPKYKLPKGFRKSLELFNHDRAAQADPAQPLVVVEGIFDCLRLVEFGHRRTVALLGCKLSARQEQLIEELVGVRNARVILMFDADDAGRSGALEAAGRLVRRSLVRILDLGAETHQPERLEEPLFRQLLDSV
jgi:DNA primase